MRDAVIGDFNNGLDNFEVKHIDILDDDGSVGTTLLATEWFAELCFSGWWQVNPAWLEAQVVPESVPAEGEPAESAP